MRWFWQKADDESDGTERQVLHAAQVHGVPVSEVVETILDEDGDGVDDRLEEGAMRRNRHVGAWVTTVIIGVLFGGGIIWLIHWAEEADASGPSAVSGIKQEQANISPTPLGLGELTGQYIALQYPGVFDTVHTLAAVPNSAERYLIGSSSDYRRSIDVWVENNTPQLTDDSGYLYRSMNPSLYKAEPVKIGTAAAVVMVKTDGTEQTLYWAHGGRVAIISLADTANTDNLTSYMQVILGSIRWLQ